MMQMRQSDSIRSRKEDMLLISSIELHARFKDSFITTRRSNSNCIIYCQMSISLVYVVKLIESAKAWPEVKYQSQSHQASRICTGCFYSTSKQLPQQILKLFSLVPISSISTFCSLEIFAQTHINKHKQATTRRRPTEDVPQQYPSNTAYPRTCGLNYSCKASQPGQRLA